MRPDHIKESYDVSAYPPFAPGQKIAIDHRVSPQENDFNSYNKMKFFEIEDIAHEIIAPSLPISNELIELSTIIYLKEIG
jgi:hypothetical protein